MTIINQNAYNAMKSKGLTDEQIKSRVSQQFGAESERAKAVDSFLSGKNAEFLTKQNTQTTMKVLTPEELKAKNLKTQTPISTPIQTTTPIKTTIPTQTSTKLKILTPDELKKKNLGAGVTTKAETKINEDKNLTSLNKLYEKGYTTEQIKTQLGKTYGVNSKEYNKALGFLKTDSDIKTKTDTIKKDITSNITSDILNKSKDDITKTKASELSKFKTDDITKTWENFTKSSDILKSNNASLLNLYGINADGTVNTENKQGLAYQIEQRRKDYEDLQNKEFSKLRSTKYQSILGNIRSQLASRGVDVSKVPQEQLIALSDRVGQAAVTDVYNAKEKIINNIQTYNDNAINQINLLREKGLVSNNEASKQIEALRQAAEGQISTINKEYVNSMLGLAEGKSTEEEAKKSNILNTITTLGTQLGLSGTSLGVLNSYVGKYNTPQEAYQAILSDLSNTNSQLYKSLKSQEEAASAQQVFKNQLELLKAQSSGSSSDKSTKFNALQQTTLSEMTGYNIQTVDDLQNVLNSGKLTQQQKDNVDKFIGGTFAGSVLSEESNP